MELTSSTALLITYPAIRGGGSSLGREAFLFLDALLTPFFPPFCLLKEILQLLGNNKGRGWSHYRGQ